MKKMMKKFTCAFFAIALVMGGALPVAALADGKVEVTNVAISIDEPAIGNTPDITPTLVSEPTGSATIDQFNWGVTSEENYDSENILNSGWSVLDTNNKFEAGKYYLLILHIDTEGTFAYDVTDTCNGQRAVLKTIDDYAIDLYYVFHLSASSSFVKGNVKYVIQNGTKNVYIKANSKKIKKLAIPATVKGNDGNTYKVTGVAKKGFKNCKKLTKVSGGANINEICANAFSGCKNLKKATFKSKALKKIGKNAFAKTKKLTKVTIKKTTKLKTVKGAFKKAGKNSGKNLTIKVKSSKKKAYKKLILKKGGNKKVKVK